MNLEYSLGNNSNKQRLHKFLSANQNESAMLVGESPMYS